MQPKTTANPHIGRKIERIRKLKGFKQDDFADTIGISQGALSKIEQSESVTDEKLQLIADGLGVTMDAIKNFNEDSAINNIQNNYDNATNNVNYQYFPFDKILELFEENKKLYERLLASERKQNELLELLLKSKDKKIKPA